MKNYIPDGYSPQKTFLDEETYSKALDALVIACVDVAATFEGKILLGKRTRHPQDDWFIFGGRMRTGEATAVSAHRLMKIEVGLSMDPSRFKDLTVFAAAWEKRAHAPEDNGTHTVSITLTVELSSEELRAINLNDEYSEMKLEKFTQVLENDEYHPAIRQCSAVLLEK